MKKIYVAMAVLAAALLSSCVQEKNFNKITVGENELSFAMQGVSTRSGEATPTAVKGVSIPMGGGVILEETVEELNPGPATKGQPVYTVTLADIYPSMGVYADGKFGDAIFNKMDDAQYKDQGWRYNHNYNGSPWPDNKEEKVEFYLRMPASGGGLSNYNKSTFELTSPENGLDQKDVLFGYANISKEEHDAELPAGYPVTMKHALSGIKFRNGHENGNPTKTIITKVELVGLNSYGKGTVNNDGSVTWSSVGTPGSFYLEFDNPTYDKDAGASNPDGTVTEWDEKLAGTTWGSTAAAAADHNLNHANGELTFWFIPQEVPDNLVMNIEFYVKTPDTPNGHLVPASIELGALLNGKFRDPDGDGTADKTGNLEWAAGQLRTYTLKPYDVDVEIKDEITATIKSNLHIANTGNVDEFVRLLIMGNWYGWKPGTTAADTVGVAPSILVGYKYKDQADATAHGGDVKDMIAPWFRSGDNGVDPYGHFDESFTLGVLSDARNGKKNDWADASGGFYYTMPIGPGEGVNSASATTDLFESYTVTNPPTIYIPVGNTREPAAFVHLVMEIVIQAIPVPEEEGTWWLKAWYDATDIAKLDPDAARNEKFKTYYEGHEYDPE